MDGEVDEGTLQELRAGLAYFASGTISMYARQAVVVDQRVDESNRPLEDRSRWIEPVPR